VSERKQQWVPDVVASMVRDAYECGVACQKDREGRGGYYVDVESLMPAAQRQDARIAELEAEVERLKDAVAKANAEVFAVWWHRGLR